MARVGTISVVVVFMLAIFATYWFATAPTRTLREIHAAARNRDMAALERLIDFQSFKASMRRLVSRDAAKATAEQKNPLAARTREMVARLVEAAITPQSIAAMFSGHLPSVKQAVAPPQPAMNAPPAEMRADWTSLSAARVSIQPKGNAGASFAFVMQREGLTWRLSGVEP